MQGEHDVHLRDGSPHHQRRLSRLLAAGVSLHPRPRMVRRHRRERHAREESRVGAGRSRLRDLALRLRLLPQLPEGPLQPVPELRPRGSRAPAVRPSHARRVCGVRARFGQEFDPRARRFRSGARRLRRSAQHRAVHGEAQPAAAGRRSARDGRRPSRPDGDPRRQGARRGPHHRRRFRRAPRAGEVARRDPDRLSNQATSSIRSAS